ncbi:hypothetical protein NECAME_07943 [Necator americanus]|nr:hypothetical protein NECAME_07943 [Necator americanus]ETN82497.1 hypothetical protein NECAME_07943 [Necator americanus]
MYPARVGDRVQLSLGDDVVTWKRVRNDDVEEFIKYCAPGENGPKCKGFVTKDDKPAEPASNAHVYANGTLVFDPLKATDVGLYSSPDQKPMVTKHEDGSESFALRGHISLVLQED